MSRGAARGRDGASHRETRFAVSQTLVSLMARNGDPDLGEWLSGLDDLLSDLETRWGISAQSMLSGGTASVCFACTSREGDVVLKLSPRPVTLMREAFALNVWADSGAVEVLDADPSRGALLLRAATPPSRRWHVGDIAPLLRGLHRPVDDGLHGLVPSLEDEVMFRLERARRVHRESGQKAAAQLNLTTASRLARRLLADADPADAVLLHGDLLDRNILDRDGHAVVIDPRPCIGEPGYDVAMWAVTHDPHVNVVNRVGALATMIGAAPDRAISWAWFLAALRGVTTSGEDREIYRGLIDDQNFRTGAST